jgi:signal transduction histidine kinase
MNVPQPRLPRRTARMRLTALYGGVFLLCGAAMLALTYLLIYMATANLRRQVEASFSKDIGKQLAGGKGGAIFHLTNGGQVAGTDHLVTAREVIRYVINAAARDAVVRASGFGMQQVLEQCAIALGITALVAVGLGWFIAGRVLRPLSVITATARRISAYSLHERLALSGPDDELKELGDTLDALFTRLQTSFEAQRRFVASASHELRTPLTRERTLLQVTLADPAADVDTWHDVSQELIASNKEQERLIEALLDLTVSESGIEEREPIDLADATAAALADIEPHGLNACVDADEAPLDGDPVLVQRLAANLISNAVRHNIPGGYVAVTTRTRNGHAVLSVTNSGPLIPPSEVDRLFQPFQRLGPRRAGRSAHGLGLSIVRAIATAHDATVAASARPDGGLAVRVTFPRPATAPATPIPGDAVCRTGGKRDIAHTYLRLSRGRRRRGSFEVTKLRPGAAGPRRAPRAPGPGRPPPHTSLQKSPWVPGSPVVRPPPGSPGKSRVLGKFRRAIVPRSFPGARFFPACADSWAGPAAACGIDLQIGRSTLYRLAV